MARDLRAEISVGVQDRLVEETPLRQHRILGQALVARGEQEAVAVRLFRIRRIDVHNIKIQRCDNIHGGQRAAHVSMAACPNHAQEVHPAPCRGKLQFQYP